MSILLRKTAEGEGNIRPGTVRKIHKPLDESPDIPPGAPPVLLRRPDTQQPGVHDVLPVHLGRHPVHLRAFLHPVLQPDQRHPVQQRVQAGQEHSEPEVSRDGGGQRYQGGIFSAQHFDRDL